jgi:hypothetical protein
MLDGRPDALGESNLGVDGSNLLAPIWSILGASRQEGYDSALAPLVCR